MNNITSFLENGRFLNLNETKFYTAILGESPSKGAKSPALWNAAFKGLEISAVMHPMDVNQGNLSSVVDALHNDDRFIGGAIAVPYKQSLLQFMDRLEPEAETIGAINCIYRDKDHLVGSNTDGAAAIYSLKNVLSPEALKGTTALILGIGGAGRAVAVYMAEAIGKAGKLILANRTSGVCEELAGRLSKLCSVEVVGFPVSHQILQNSTIVVNCTTIGYAIPRIDFLGFYSLRPYTPLGRIDNSIRVHQGEKVEQRYMNAALSSIKANLNDSLDALAIMKHPVIFDIIYQPLQTTLLNLSASFGFPTINGAIMNLEQAVIAFKKVMISSNMANIETEHIRNFMSKV